SRRRHTRFSRDWSSDVCSSDLTIRLSAISLPAANGPSVALRSTPGSVTFALTSPVAVVEPSPWSDVAVTVRLRVRLTRGLQVKKDRKSVVEGKRGGVGGTRDTR